MRRSANLFHTLEYTIVQFAIGVSLSNQNNPFHHGILVYQRFLLLFRHCSSKTELLRLGSQVGRFDPCSNTLNLLLEAAALFLDLCLELRQTRIA